MSKRLAVPVVLFLSYCVAPVIAAETVHLYFGGKLYDVELNGVPGRICGGKSAQIVSPRDPIGGDPDRPAGKLVGKGETFPLQKVKKGEQLGSVTLTTDGETFPFTVEMKDVAISDAMIRGNGTWTASITWSSCSNVPKKK